MITDHDIKQLSNDWYSNLKDKNIGVRTAFAAGFICARNLLFFKAVDLSDTIKGCESCGSTLTKCTICDGSGYVDIVNEAGDATTDRCICTNGYILQK